MLEVPTRRMGLVGLLLRFTLVYLLSLALCTMLVQYVSSGRSAIASLAALFIATVYVCSAFRKKNQSSFSPRERWHAWLAMLAVDMSLQTGFSYLYLARQKIVLANHATLLISTWGFILLLHGAAIYAFIWLGEKYFVQRNALPTTRDEKLPR